MLQVEDPFKPDRPEKKAKYRYRCPNVEKAIKYITLEIIRVSSLQQGNKNNFADELATLRSVRFDLEDHLGGL